MPSSKKSKAALHSSPGPILYGGYEHGEKLYFTGSNMLFEDGDRLVYGAQGKVTGTRYERGGIEKVMIRFPFNDGNVACTLESLSRSPPPDLLPGGYTVGEKLYYVACNFTCDRYAVMTGEQGIVEGAGIKEDQLAMAFPNNSVSVSCWH